MRLDYRGNDSPLHPAVICALAPGQRSCLKYYTSQRRRCEVKGYAHVTLTGVARSGLRKPELFERILLLNAAARIPPWLHVQLQAGSPQSSRGARVEQPRATHNPESDIRASNVGPAVMRYRSAALAC